ncbi:MAG: glycosyltransferase family 2 protein [Muribaculum sp.]|nr:glycosyltransferase family 2 protein [Muribaculum sp.]
MERKNSKFKIQNSKLVTVIVPVWNAAEFLREALESLRVQTHAHFEAVLVNDGSTDNSPDICREFCDADARFRLIDQPNAGVSAARNAGIDSARGEWIAFMDADDLMMPDAIEVLLKSAKESDAGIVVGGYKRGKSVRLSGCQVVKMQKCHDDKVLKVMNSDEAIRIGLYQKRILNNPWGVLFHRTVFGGNEPLRFRRCRYEDLDLFYRAFEKVDRVCVLDKYIYFYRDVPGSFINTWSDSRLDVLDVTDRMVEHFRHGDPDLLRAARDRRFSAHFNMLLTMRRFGIDNPVQKRRCINVIKEQRHAELADPNVRLKNKLGALLSYILCIK